MPKIVVLCLAQLREIASVWFSALLLLSSLPTDEPSYSKAVRKGEKGMILPLAKLGTLALKTFCKPIANRLKRQAGVHPKFRQFIVNIAQVRTFVQLSPL